MFYAESQIILTEWADRKHQSRDKVLVRKALDAAEKASQALIPG